MYFKQFLQSFVFIFGVMQVVFVVGNLLPRYSGRDGITWDQVILSLISSFIFSVSHFIITSDWLDERATVKKRIIICGIPCTIICCLLAFKLGLQRLMPHTSDIFTASALWIASYAISVGAYIGIFILIELNQKKQEQRYSEALSKYKKESNS